MNDRQIIQFSPPTVSALNGAAVNRFAAVATAAREAIDHDRKITVRCFADSLRAVTVGLGMAQGVLAAAIKAAKDGTDVEQAMTDAAKTIAAKARAARARASEKAADKATVKALANTEDTLAALAGRAKSSLLIQIETQRAVVAALLDDLKSARKTLAKLEAEYLIQQKGALKSA